MYKDPTEWRNGFKIWKETGESPWKAGKRLPRFATGTEPLNNTQLQNDIYNPVKSAQNAIDFAKMYYDSEGFKQRFNNLNKSIRGFLYSSFNPAAIFTEEDGWLPMKYTWSVQKTPIKFNKVGPSHSPEANAYYNKDTGNIIYGDDSTLRVGNFKTWDEVMAHEAGHALDFAIKPNNSYLAKLPGSLDIYNDGYGYTYSNMHPIFRKSKAYLNVRNAMYQLDRLHGILYDQDPSYGSHIYTDNGTFHDAMPSESYADLFLLRKMLYDLKIFDSTKKGIKFTKQDFEKFKKNNHKTRLLDNFSDEDIIWMINNVANNSVKINPPSV